MPLTSHFVLGHPDHAARHDRVIPIDEENDESREGANDMEENTLQK